MEILLDNKNGNVWDITDIVTDVTWKTSRIGRPSSLSFSFIDQGIFQDEAFQINNGDILRFRKDGTNVFYGYVMTIESGMDENVKITAYDQLRYLLSNDTYKFVNKTATEIIQKIAGDVGLKTGSLESSGYKIPTMLEDDKKLLDIICKALDLTILSNGKNFVLYDDFGQLILKDSTSMLLDFYLGDESLMYDYSYQASIDTDTYNRIKLVQDNKKSKKRDVYISQDSSSISKWGRLQLFKKVDEGMTKAQINQILNTLIAVKNREVRRLSLNAIGDIRVRAGCFVPVSIERLGINQPFLVDECTHKFDGTEHTMSVELKVI
ncbi:hypothetical protein [Brevibacillus laterosporus]|uniref:YqbQ/XkdQ domain-containing protein n=1 Tax=Brevibacillus laterosporus TaxID=1465 RepID=A0AAP3DIB2_BRELA|nr:hypothetical protein [Brevibacillus laterosporus]MCR8981576.1 hypothetical protein [Brevibacillus laterosporus]MCZ0808731.1 hypothetical protein [Brevibacillus laterosporus]MCZ0827296.1 hypothetical protein [Brevibacillus laterosporus]MCZ0851052.1 hypothetical protein [Brevibacillus laterosporus]